MARIIFDLLIVCMGLLATPFLFYHFPRIGEGKGGQNLPAVSIIIPARNEAKTLPLLLEDLRDQSVKPLEIICADDGSSDGTGLIAEAFGVKVLSLSDKPDGWVGKNWACYNGANEAKGQLFLFVDADVRLGPHGLERLLQTYKDLGCALSVQPYHSTERWYEQFSLLFNLIQIGANGTALPKPLGVGLYGPVIMLSKEDYLAVDGHEGVRDSIIEDMALGQRLKDAGIPYRLFVGDPEISFRMYPDGFNSLIQGWVKNIAAGAAKTPPSLFWPVFLWITSMTSVPLHMAFFAVPGDSLWVGLYAALYVLWAALLYFLSKKIGGYRFLSILFYPILLIVLFAAFSVSAYKKVFGREVIWKDRSIGKEGRGCK